MDGYPDWTRAVIARLQAEAHLTITYRETLAGKSGAFVGLVDCTGSHDGIYVLKVGHIPHGYPDEETLHDRARQIGAFNRQTPTIVARCRDSQHYALLFELGGHSRIQWRPLVESPGIFASGYRKLVELLWTPTLLVLSDLASPSRVITESLDYQLEPERGGRIRDNIETFLGSDLLSSTHFVHVGEVLPNPYYFVCAAPREPDVDLRILYGPVHGDCHAANVLVKANIDGEVEENQIIDLASFGDRKPFIFDHLYFELATLLRMLENIGERRWIRLTSALAQSESTRDGNLHQSERAWMEDIWQGRALLVSQLTAQYPQRYDDIRLQTLLSGVASGLAFVNKRPKVGSGSFGLSEAQFRQAFVWAATFLEQYLRESNGQYPNSSDKIPVIGKTPKAAPFTFSDDQWKCVGGFDPTGFNILILGPGLRDSYQRQVTDLLELSWPLVIDFCTSSLTHELLESGQLVYRQSWPDCDDADVGPMKRGGIWYFADGRGDLSDAQPSSDNNDWRRRYSRPLLDMVNAISDHMSPNAVRALFVTEGFPLQLVRLAEDLDTIFGDRLAPIVVAADSHPDLTQLSALVGARDSVLAQLLQRREPVLPNVQSEPLLPQRQASGAVSLAVVPADLTARVDRDLTLLASSRAHSFPADRRFGLDFRRGMPVEWAELEQGLDVRREIYYRRYSEELVSALGASSNRTVNLMHEPSAGGTTLSRRLAWDLKTKFPVAILEQVSQDTASYITEVFRWCKLPVLVVMESSIITESARERLLDELREDNTRAVFLWVARKYDSTIGPDVLPSELSREEAAEFRDAYLEQLDEPARRSNIERLTVDLGLREQRSPFFFGLTAFGERYLGLDNLIRDSVNDLSEEARSVLGDLALVSLYSSSGFPIIEFDEIMHAVCGGAISVLVPPFAVRSYTHVRIPNNLMAKRTLAALARDPSMWRADLARLGNTLLDNIRKLSNRSADRLLQMIQTVFVTRDTVGAIEGDTETKAGGFGGPRRFSPYIHDVGSGELAREVLKRIANLWPDQPHHAVHYARHLLYESPTDVDMAIEVATTAGKTKTGEKDDAVAHTIGMCYRAKMEDELRAAKENGRAFQEISESVRRSFDEALHYFEQSMALANARSEYGHVSSIQTASKLIRNAMDVSGDKKLEEFLRPPQRGWCLGVIARAEHHIERLREMPRNSVRAQRAIAEWDLVYGNIESVVNQLRALARRHEDPEVRSALCRVLLAKYKRTWPAITQGDLKTIVMFSERNIEGRGVRDSDVRAWLRAYRYLSSYDSQVAIRRLNDWHQLKPASVEPPFYLYVLYFVSWLNSDRSNRSLAQEINRWAQTCAENRPYGRRGWGYEWLTVADGRELATHFSDLGFDPVATITGIVGDRQRKMLQKLARIEGTVVKYKGRQQAELDLGQGVFLRFTPLDRINKDDEGKRASVFVAFAYDGIRGWDACLV